MKVAMDREQWSESSKRSEAYNSRTECYQDIRYICMKCKALANFSAWAQKAVFEQRKRYVWQRRSLCTACNAELFRLRNQERVCQVRWAAERRVLARDPVFLRHWLDILTALPAYVPRYRNTMVRTLAELLNCDRPERMPDARRDLHPPAHVELHR